MRYPVKITSEIVKQYLKQKRQHAFSLGYQSCLLGKISQQEVAACAGKSFFCSKMTYLHQHKREDTQPMPTVEGTLLVRNLPKVNLMSVFVGDVVVVKDPDNKDNFLVRRLAAIEGDEITSKDETEESFFLDRDYCWLSSDDETLTPKEAHDSRVFGPVSMTNIIGRVIYMLKSAVDHCPVVNSPISMRIDYPVRTVELDITEMENHHKASDKSGVVIEQFEPGVYVTLNQLRDGIRVFERVNFKINKHFTAKQADEWWRLNENRVLQKYHQQGIQTEPSTRVPPPPVSKKNDASTSASASKP